VGLAPFDKCGRAVRVGNSGVRRCARACMLARSSFFFNDGDMALFAFVWVCGVVLSLLLPLPTSLLLFWLLVMLLPRQSLLIGERRRFLRIVGDDDTGVVVAPLLFVLRLGEGVTASLFEVVETPDSRHFSGEILGSISLYWCPALTG